ncbi:MAG: hypothetical protein NTY38_10345 [Acidobacteria bacterium]|nr:hypothetical protein [Acidobacteriota bacterium]
MIGFVLLFLALPRSGTVPPGANRTLTLPGAGWLPQLGRFRFSIPQVTLNESFHRGLSDWQPADLRSLSGAANDWVYRAGSVRPGRLRLWAPSLKLTDYSFDFQAEVEKNGLGWAFRASNRDNHYGTRIEILKPGRMQVSQIVHFAMVNGKEQDRVELPLPIDISPNSTYQVTVRIRGNRFVTSINSQVVDSWTDNRLKTGGVGFFAQKGDVASILSVNVSSERSLWDRVFASFVLLPPMSMAD